MTHSLYEAKREAAMRWIANNPDALQARSDYMLSLRLRWDNKYKKLTVPDVRGVIVPIRREAAQSCGGEDDEQS